MRRKFIDLRTERGQRVFNNIRKFYCSLDYGIDNEILYSEGITHIIDWNGNQIIL